MHLSQAFLLAVNLFLHTQNHPHRLRRLFLCRGCHMCIGIQRESRGEVSQHARHRLDVDTILEGEGGEGVS